MKIRTRQINKGPDCINQGTKEYQESMRWICNKETHILQKQHKKQGKDSMSSEAGPLYELIDSECKDK